MTLRRAQTADAPALACLHRLSMRTAMPFLPDLHTPDEDLGFYRERVLAGCEVWLAEEAGEARGLIAFREGWIDHLYIHPEHQGRGLGKALLAKALAGGAPRRLWAFQKNLRARGFYEHAGFVLERLTDGAGNEEQEPDALYLWSGAV